VLSCQFLPLIGRGTLNRPGVLCKASASTHSGCWTNACFRLTGVSRLAPMRSLSLEFGVRRSRPLEWLVSSLRTITS
jgi:hypothetical protein